VSALATISMRRAAVEIAAGMSIVWFLPNTQQILARFRPSLQKTAWEDGGSTDGALRWMPTAGWAVGVGVVLFVVLVQLEAPSTFLYFQF
jgi:hypothetical protein